MGKSRPHGPYDPNATYSAGEFSFLANSTQLVGSYFKDPVLVSAIAVNGICALSFAVLFIATWYVKSKGESGRLVFLVLSGLLGIMFMSV
jgi:uncharacterized membrane protein YjdF